MNQITRRASVAYLTGFGALLLVRSACPHNIWITVDKKPEGQLVAQLNYGDPDKRDPVDIGKVVTLELIAPSGHISMRRPLEVATRLGQPVLQTKQFSALPGSLLSVIYDDGFWTQDPSDNIESNSSKLLIPTAKKSWWVPKFGKTLLGPGAYRFTAHTKLEIIPLKDPFEVAIGLKLPVRVDFNGKPLAGVDVLYDDGIAPISDDNTPRVKTGSDGVANIPITRAGPYRITAGYETSPSSAPGLADKDDLDASLAFELDRHAEMTPQPQ